MAAFLDTNVLVYAFADNSSNSIDKVAIARRLIDELSVRTEIILSAQVLNEFSANAMRKASPPLTIHQTSAIVRRLSTQTIVAIDSSLVLLALQRVQQSRISYWDALIVEAAIRSGATTLYTEDLHHGTRYGTLEIRNPFLP